MKTTMKLGMAALLFCLVLPSCLKDQEDLFDENPTVRMTEYLANAKKVLMSPANGWVMCYYPDNAQSYGGYNYTVKFTDDKVEAGFEFAANLDETVTSLYRLGTDSGPMLSFDTNNDFLHYFSTPSSSNYQAYGGDFEFILLEVEEDHVKMMGRRSGNTIMMYPLEEESGSYLRKVASIAEEFIISGMKGAIGGVDFTADIDQDYQQVTFDFGEQSETIAYMFTTEGISLYRPLEIGGVSVRDFTFDPKTLALSVPGVSGEIQGVVPEGYRRYYEYEGDYLLIYNYVSETNYRSIPVKLVPESTNSTYVMTGLNDKFHFQWRYNRSKGTLAYQYQSLGTMDNGNTVRLCAIDDASGYFTWAANVDYGITVWNGDEANPEYTITPGYSWTSGTRISDAIYLCMWNSAGTRLGAPESNSGWRFPGNATSMKLHSLVKQ